MTRQCRMLGSNGYTKKSWTTDGTTEGSGWRGDPAKDRQGNRVCARDHCREDRLGAAPTDAFEKDPKAGKEGKEAIAAQGEKAGQEEATQPVRAFAYE